VIFVDSNVPMYLIGSPHSHKADAQVLLESLVAAKQRLVCDAEVMQEILHRYSAIDRHEAIPLALDVLLQVVDEIFPIESQDVQRAATIVSGQNRLSARDALHIAIMERHGIDTIFSFDTDFDRWPRLRRISRA
jgi:predicted nucleic acid-binding protein